MKEQIIILLLYTLTPVLCNRIPYEDCGSQYKLKSVDIPQCTILPCQLIQSTKQEIFVNMTSTAYVSSVEQKVFIIMKGIQYDVYNVNPIPCTQNMSCPIYKNSDASFPASFQVPVLPPYTSHLQWELWSMNRERFLCFKVRIQILAY